jgi:hypothetical protein
MDLDPHVSTPRAQKASPERCAKTQQNQDYFKSPAKLAKVSGAMLTCAG